MQLVICTTGQDTINDFGDKKGDISMFFKFDKKMRYGRHML